MEQLSTRRRIQEIEATLLCDTIVELRNGYAPIDIATALLLQAVTELRQAGLSGLCIGEVLIEISQQIMHEPPQRRELR